jgi:hypothetical protein
VCSVLRQGDRVMSRWRTAILAVLPVLAVSVPAYADMAPVIVSDSESGSRAVSMVEGDGHVLCREVNLTKCCRERSVVGLVPVGLSIEGGGRAHAASDVQQPTTILIDRQDSMTLCLYALLGLGLCKSAPWVRKLTFGTIPEWYHDGGPFQVGHSCRIAPDCTCPQEAYFLQPEDQVGSRGPGWRRELHGSLRGKSRSAANTDTCRGPPYFALCRESLVL